MYLVDGGLYSRISIGEQIERCREEVASDKDIIVDSIMVTTDPVEIAEWNLEATYMKNAYDFY